MNCLRFFLLVLLLLGVAGASTASAQGLVVYKHVDPSGRTTYSNQPIKGAVVVELTPLTVLPKAQTSLAATVAQTRPVEQQPSASTNGEPVAQQSATLSPASADRASAPVEKSSLPASPPSQAVANPQRGLATDSRRSQNSAATGSTNAATVAQQRREEVRRRIIEAEIEAEAQLLAEAQANLQREQSKSVAMRSLRAAIVVDERAAAGKQPLGDDILATKMVVERHFERVRELQDQVLMHEENLAELRIQLRAPPQRVALKTAASTQPTAIVTTAQLGSAPRN
jgi:hypothetical protein